MNEKKNTLTTLFRIIFVVLLQAALYRDGKFEIFLAAVTVTSIAIWILPALCTKLSFTFFKIKDEYPGTFIYDDSDITNCKFNVIFNVDPEELIHMDTFAFKVERGNLRKDVVNKTSIK